LSVARIVNAPPVLLELSANMKVDIREYCGSDRASLVRLLEELQDYLVSIDDLKRMRRLPEYGESYTDRTLQNVARNNGKILMAEADGEVVGAVVGIISEQTKEDLLELIPYKRGLVLELVVKHGYRRRGIGTLLMEEMEAYFRQKGCRVSNLEVFSPNKNAYRLYSKIGYGERSTWMTKSL